MIKDYSKKTSANSDKQSSNSSTSLLLGGDEDFYSSFGASFNDDDLSLPSSSSGLGWESWANFAANNTFSDSSSSIAPQQLQSSSSSSLTLLPQQQQEENFSADIAIDDSFLDFETDSSCTAVTMSQAPAEDDNTFFTNVQNNHLTMQGIINATAMPQLQSQLRNQMPFHQQHQQHQMSNNSQNSSPNKKPLNLFESLQKTQESQQMMQRNFLFNGGSPLMHAQMGANHSPMMATSSSSSAAAAAASSLYYNPYDHYQHQLMMMQQQQQQQQQQHQDTYKRSRLSFGGGVGGPGGMMAHGHHHQHHYQHPMMMMMNLPPTKVPLSKQQYSSPSSQSSSSSIGISNSSSPSFSSKETSQPLILPSSLTGIGSVGNATKRPFKDSSMGCAVTEDGEESKGGSSTCNGNSSSSTIEETLNQFLADTEDISSATSTVANLKSILRKYALNATGKKEDLFARINQIRDHYLRPSLKAGRAKSIIAAATAASPESPAMTAIPSTAGSSAIKAKREEFEGDQFFADNLVFSNSKN